MQVNFASRLICIISRLALIAVASAAVRDEMTNFIPNPQPAANLYGLAQVWDKSDDAAVVL
jgi:hypothetical protein